MLKWLKKRQKNRLLNEIDILLAFKESSKETERFLELSKIKLDEGVPAVSVENGIRDYFGKLMLTPGESLSDPERRFFHNIQRRTGAGTGRGLSL